MKTPTRYIDAHDENISSEDALALYNREAKPYPSSWYDSEEEVLESVNAALEDEYSDMLQEYKSDIAFCQTRSRRGAVAASYQNKRSRWERFSCDVRKWANLAQPR